MEKGKVNMSTFKEGFIKYGQDHGYIKPKKKSETCEQKLRRMCKSIAQEITEGEDADVGQWMEGVYDIEWITYQDGRYKAARLLVAGGGPTIWVNVYTNEVEGYWAGDKVIELFQDNLELRAYLEDIHAGSK